jgi:hypothetical protein
LRCQVGSGKASASEPLLTCRNKPDGIETGETKSLRDEPGGCPFIGQVVSGMKAARARTAAPARNVGRRAMTMPPGRDGERERPEAETKGTEYRRAARWRTGS